MSNDPRSAVLYVGLTGNLPHRVWHHKRKLVPGFTAHYKLTRLVYYELFCYPDAAIAREKEIKGWRRTTKIKLIHVMNPKWEDMPRDWQNRHKPDPTGDSSEIPRPAGENAGLRDDATVRSGSP